MQSGLFNGLLGKNRNEGSSMNAYRKRIWERFSFHLHKLGPQTKVLDFGCGDGWFTSKVRELNICEEIVPLDVKIREKRFVDPILYSGGVLPFPERSFSLSYAVDVLHHCPEPDLQLRELARVTDKYILIKDHTYCSRLGKFALAVLDELGNRKYGIPSPNLYQQGWSWRAILEAQGWHETILEHPLFCHNGLMGELTNSLQYISIFQRRQ